MVGGICMTNGITPNVIGELVAHAINVAESRKLIPEEGNVLKEVNDVFSVDASDGVVFLLALRTAELISEDLVTFFADARRRGIVFERTDERIKMKPGVVFSFKGFQSFAEYRQKQMIPRVEDIKIVLRDVEGWFTTSTDAA